MPERPRTSVTGRISTSHAAARKCDSDPPVTAPCFTGFSTRTCHNTRPSALAPTR
jgi:hypothetical protein